MLVFYRIYLKILKIMSDSFINVYLLVELNVISIKRIVKKEINL